MFFKMSCWLDIRPVAIFWGRAWWDHSSLLWSQPFSFFRKIRESFEKSTFFPAQKRNKRTNWRFGRFFGPGNGVLTLTKFGARQKHPKLCNGGELLGQIRFRDFSVFFLATCRQLYKRGSVYTLRNVVGTVTGGSLEFEKFCFGYCIVWGKAWCFWKFLNCAGKHLRK